MGTTLAHEVALGDRAPFGEVLVASGVITREQLEATQAQERQLAAQGRSVQLQELLLRNRFTTAAQIQEAIQAGRPGDAQQVQEQLLSPAVCSKHQVIPVGLAGGILTIKTARVLPSSAIAAIKNAAAVRVDSVRVLCADRQEVHGYLTRQMAHDSFASMLDRLRASEHSAALVRMTIDALLHEAIELRVSDIHMDLKPEPDSFISLRVDGELQQAHLLDFRLMASLCSRIKTLAGMDASNNRAAQDGRLEIEHHGRMVGFRVATQPLMDGETLTVRIIDAASLPTAQALFPHQPEMLSLLRAVSSANGKSGGLMLVTGPTGSGKSTTLYTAASMFPRDRYNLITVENPVEYKLPFARQIQLQDLLGQKATDIERSILRQDPDVLILGEIRDTESAKAALKFAESGHFVLSTLHSQSAGTTVERLMSFIPDGERNEASFVVASTLKAIVNQRLFSRLCDCSMQLTAEQYQSVAGARDLERVMGAPVPVGTHRKVGCNRCRGTGYKGRVAVHETMLFPGNEKHRDALAKTLSTRSSVKALLATGAVRMHTKAATVQTLLHHGIIDVATASNALNVQDVVEERNLELVEGDAR
jgi:type II secretory ATPase GspE/PulE/Tfp pilus assembly ATPase PilB-like protein